MARLFNEASKISPDDADVHIVLGVMYNLSREYEKAIEAFQTALKLKPRDYSLWNKLGATQANSVQSADAIFAYQQVTYKNFFCVHLSQENVRLDHSGRMLLFIIASMTYTTLLCRQNLGLEASS